MARFYPVSNPGLKFRLRHAEDPILVALKMAPDLHFGQAGSRIAMTGLGYLLASLIAGFLALLYFWHDFVRQPERQQRRQPPKKTRRHRREEDLREFEHDDDDLDISDLTLAGILDEPGQ